MSMYYPQAALSLKVRWENFGDTNNFPLKEDYSFNVLAKRVRVSINDYSTADTFDAEIDYKNFPFDPRCIRSVGVVVAMQDSRKIFNTDNSLNPLKISAENTVFIGFADDQSISFDDAKRVVRLEGRDYTALLIDRKYLGGPLNLEQPLDLIIQSLLDSLDETRPLKIDVRVPEALPVVASYFGSNSSNDPLSGKKNTRKDESYWDVIQDLVARAGLIAYVELDRLVITRPRVLYGPDQAKRFIYGRNVKNLEYKRKLGRRKNFNLAVRSLSIEGKEVLEALIPAEATDEWSRETGITNLEIKVPQLDGEGKPLPEKDLKAAPYISYRVPNVENKDQLIKIGQEIYEEIGRQQIEGSFETAEMRTSWLKVVEGKSQFEEFDILKIRNGTPVEVYIDQKDMRGLNKLDGSTLKMNFLKSRGYEDKAAEALAKVLSNPRLNGPLYTKAVTFTMDAEQGFSANVEFINFIQIGEKYAAP